MSSNPKLVSAAWMVAESLAAAGVRQVFACVGGNCAATVMACVRHPLLRVTSVAHETAALYAAEAYSVVSGEAAAVFTISGPGAFQALSGATLCMARRGSRILLVTGEVPRATAGRGAAQDGTAYGVSLNAAARAVLSFSAQASCEVELAQALSFALRALAFDTGVAHVSIPTDLATQPVSRGLVPERLELPDDPLAEAVEWLRHSERPLILAGRGVDAEVARQLRRLVARGMAYGTTLGAKGRLGESSAACVGTFLLSNPRGRLALEAADRVLVVGSSLSEFSTYNFASTLTQPGRLIQVDRDASVFGRAFPCLPLHGDARRISAQLCEALQSSRVCWSADWVRELESPRGERAPVPSRPLDPVWVFQRINAHLPKRCRIFADIGTVSFYAGSELVLEPEQEFYCDLNWACVSQAVAGAFGASLAGEEPTLCLCGDLAFTNALSAVKDAAESGVGPLVWVVFSNHGSRLVDAGMRQHFPADEELLTGRYESNSHLARVAQGLGLCAERVENAIELDECLERAFARRRPCVVEVVVDPDAAPDLSSRNQSLFDAAGRRAPRYVFDLAALSPRSRFGGASRSAPGALRNAS